MSDNKYYYVTVTNLREKIYSNFYGKANEYDESNSTSTPHFVGDLYFDNELIKNKRFEHNYREGLLVGSVDFSLGERDRDFDSILSINNVHVIHESHSQSFDFRVFCGEELFENLRKASSKFLEIRIRFELGEWDTNDSDYYNSRCKIKVIEIHNPIFTEAYYEDKRVRHVENYLLTELCGGKTNNQIPTICKEIAQAFSSTTVFAKRNELYESLIPFVNGIRLTFDANKSDLRKRIESSEDADLRKLFWTDGDNFYDQLAKITNDKEKNDVLIEYNYFWKRVKAVDIFEKGYEWSGDQLTSIADDYLKIPFINSPTLNAILFDGLLLKDIADRASFLQYNGLITAEAILSVKTVEYVKSAVKVKNKSISQVFTITLVNSVIELLSIAFNGVLIWFFASILSGNNELAHYVLFGTLFSASFIVGNLNKGKTTEAIKENKEEEKFYLLRDMCNLHTQSEFMNSGLLKHLMYKLEERGVLFNSYLYEILKRC